MAEGRVAGRNQRGDWGIWWQRHRGCPEIQDRCPELDRPQLLNAPSVCRQDAKGQSAL